MKKLFSFSLSLLMISTICFAQTNEIEAVKLAYKNYAGAILIRDGDEAVKYIDKNAIIYYARILNWSRYADSATVSKLSLIDKFSVLLIRAKISKTEIMSLDGRSLYAFLINSIGSKPIQIKDVVVEGNTAKVQIGEDIQPSSYFTLFHKEEGEWKVDPIALFPQSEQYLKQMVAKSFGGDENSFCVMVAGMSTGKKPGREIWQPIE